MSAKRNHFRTSLLHAGYRIVSVRRWWGRIRSRYSNRGATTSRGACSFLPGKNAYSVPYWSNRHYKQKISEFPVNARHGGTKVNLRQIGRQMSIFSFIQPSADIRKDMQVSFRTPARNLSSSKPLLRCRLKTIPIGHNDGDS